MPVGFRFRPTDEELVDYYLKHKLLADDFPVHIIPEIDLCKVEPWDVPGNANTKNTSFYHQNHFTVVLTLFSCFKFWYQEDQ